MGNCCGKEGVDISTGNDAGGSKEVKLQQVNYAHHQKETSAAPGYQPQSGTASVPPRTASQMAQPEYALRYPGDSSGVYYQPTGPSVGLMGAPFNDDYNKDHSPQPSPTALPPPSASGPAASIVATTIVAAAVREESAFPEPATTQPIVEATQAPPAEAAPAAAMPSGLKRTVSYEPRDVMISYSRTDKEIMLKIKAELEKQGITVWVDVSSIDAGADFLSKIGEAIIDAKLFICLLSEKAVKSKYCRDEVALAYVSNTVIFPVNLQPREHLLPLMDTGLKLQLANYNWTSLTDSDTMTDNIQSLVSIMKGELDDLGGPTEGGSLSPSPSDTWPSTVTKPASPTDVTGEEVTSPSDVMVGIDNEHDRGDLMRQQSTSPDREMPDFKLRMLRERNRVVATLQDDDISHVMPDQFWSDQFGVSEYVMWDSFTEAFLRVFKDPVENTFSTEDQQQLMDILKRELEVDTDDRLYKYQLIAFCGIHGEVLALWSRVYEQARESFAMKEVFSMDSSVRVEAIENLGKFRSAAVIDALRDLLSDPDANVRAVATVSLSRTNANDPVTIRHILRTLSDKDRLVREAGCLALGHLKARQAVSKLSHLWRNDVISHVRDAAAVALRQIGGQDVEDIMRVTKVLAEEIRSLTETK